MFARESTGGTALEVRAAMWKWYRLLAGPALVAILGVPLWTGGGQGIEQVVGQRLESLVLPTAVAAVIQPAAPSTVPPVSPEQFEAARLLMGGTMLFGLAAVLRRTI